MNLKFDQNRTVLTSAHLQGSNKLSMNPDQGVIDPDFRVWGYDNLYVCDSSVFPTSVGANPMQTIYTFAKIFADKFIEKHRRGI